MIDTLKFLIPIDDQSVLNKIKTKFKRFRKDDLETGKMEFEFFNGDLELGTYHRKIAVKVSNNPSGLTIEFSIPKYWKGNNVEMIHANELPKIMDQFYGEVCDRIDYTLAHYSTWIIYRLDICYNWILENEERVMYAINFLQRLDVARKNKSTYRTTVMFGGRVCSIKFYAKGSEFKKHDAKEILFDRSYPLQLFADKILRYEVGLRKDYLAKQLGKKTVYLRDITSDELIIKLLNFYLKDNVFKYIHLDTMTNEDIKEILFSKFTQAKATRLYQFYKGFYFDQEMKQMWLAGGMDRVTIYRYKKDLKDAGIGFSSDILPETVNIIKSLVIPSSTSKFNLLD